MKTTIYYFSASGNSLKIAKDLAKKLDDTEIVQITENNNTYINDTAERVGFVFPVYFWGAPAIVKEFIKKLQIRKATYVFSIANCGHVVISANLQIEELLKAKEIKLSASYKIKMPESYQIFFKVPSEKNQIELFKKQEQKMTKIAEDIKSNKIIAAKGIRKCILKFSGDIVSGAFKPKDKDRHFWTDEKCNGCGICQKVCPVNNIKMNNGKPEWQHNCEQCLACLQWCPQKSIQYKKATLKKGRYSNPYVKLKDIIAKK